jgi:hypothetical protein
MRAIEYGFKNFGNYSFSDSESNIYVFNDKFEFEKEAVTQSPNYYLKEVIQNENGQFISKEDGDELTLNEFWYLETTGIVTITEINNQVYINENNILQTKNIIQIDSENNTQIGSKFFVKLQSELGEVIITAASKGKKVLPGSIIILNEILKENKQSAIFFISSNGALIERAYQNITNVFDNELVIFLETNEENNLFGTVVRVKTGKNFNSIHQIPFSAFTKVSDKFNATITNNNWKDLFQMYFSDRDNKIFLVLRRALGIGTKVITITQEIAFDVLGNIAETVEGLLGELVIDKKYWKYYDEKGKPIKDNNLLLPIDELLKLKEKIDEKKIAQFMKPAVEKAIEIKKIIQQFIQKLASQHKSIRKLFKRLDIFDNFIDALIDFLKNPLDLIVNIGIDFLIFLNAFVIGLLNGIIEAIQGLFNLVKLIAFSLRDITRNAEEMVTNFMSYTSLFFEIIENGIEFFTNLFTLKNLKAIINFQREALGLLLKTPEIISNFLQSASIRIDQFGYNLGYVIGVIVEIILEILFTGGAKTIAGAAKLFVEQLQTLLKGTAKLSEKLKDLPIAALDKIIYMMRTLDDFAKNLPTFLDDIMKNLKEILLKVKDFVMEFWNKLNEASRKRLENWGLKPTKFEDNILNLCPINP